MPATHLLAAGAWPAFAPDARPAEPALTLGNRSDARPGPAPGRRVAFYCGGSAKPREGHDLCSKAAVTRTLAELLGLEFSGDLDHAYDARLLPSRAPYIVPSDTVTGLAEADRLGIHSAHDFFGGVVPHAFVATKVITHGLVAPDAAAPAGWSPDMAERVRDVVLEGHAAFSPDDARRAGLALLAHGAVRVKEAGGVGGTGQSVVRDRASLDAALAALDPGVLAAEGIVLERNLAEVETLSVGQVQVGEWTLSYVGEQYTTRNHRGHEVYGGSTLEVVRGGWDALLGLPLADAQRTAIEQALRYDESAMLCYPGLLASRRNYDVAQGRDDRGRWVSGVLEQSWRIGGASAAEVAALRAFRADPHLHAVRASTHEFYADGVNVPTDALLYYDATDAQVGRLVKYARIEPHVDA